MLNKLDVDKATLIAMAQADKLFGELLDSYEIEPEIEDADEIHEIPIEEVAPQPARYRE